MIFFTKEPIKRKLLLLAGIFIAALTTVVATEVYLRHLTQNYDAAIENQMAHRRLGRVIIRKLTEMEKNVFGLYATDDIRDVPVFEKQILSSIGTIESTLGVLQNGGAFVDVLPANIIKRDNITEEFFYRKTGDADYIIEVIDLTPKIVDIKELSTQFFRAVRRRFESPDKEQRRNNKSEVSVLLKRLNTFLLRSRENATKIFYESHQEIQRFEQLKRKTVRLFSIIRYSVILIVGIVAAFTFALVFHRIGEIIENRKKAEAKVNTLKQQMEFILGATNTGLDIIDSDFNIQYIDPEWQKVYGDPKGRKCYEYFMDRNEACPSCGLVKALRTKSIAVTEEILIKENNRPVQVSTIPFKSEDDEWLVAEVKADITERKHNEQELRKHRDHLEELVKERTAELDQIFNTAADGMRVIDKDFNVLRINDTLAVLAKQSKDEMLGKKCYETISSSSCHTADCPLTRILKEENVSRLSVELEKSRTDGTKFPCIVTATPFFGPDGKLVGIVEDIKDISERKQAEQSLKKAKETVEQTNVKLEAMVEQANELAEDAMAANKAKSEFLANMSHEIRTPMNAIIGFSNMLAEEKLAAEQMNYVHTIREAGQNLLRLIDDILDFSKIEAGKLDVEIVDCSLAALLDSVESVIKPKAREKELDFQIIESNGLPAKIRSDPARLHQCLFNIIGNAIKFTERGYVHLKVSLQEDNGNPFIHFDVEDSGIGIPKDKQEAIFESFTQADGSHTRKFDGSGLGLSITKQLMELLGGELTLTSTEGESSVFSLVIPAGVDVIEQPFLDRCNISDQFDAEQNKPQEPKFDGHVLVAEDVKTNQMLIKLLLEKMGFEVTITEDGNEAMQQAFVRKFDLIFMDIQMPNMNGYEATKALRKQGLTTPIIALTAHAMKGDDKKCLRAGCDDYLSKPLDQKKLLKTVKKYLICKSPASNRKVDSIRSQVDELTELCHNQTPEQSRSEKTVCNKGREEIINWDRLINRLGDEELINEIVPIFLNDSKERFGKLTEAVKSKDSKAIKFYGHAIKGAARNVGAEQLSEIASKIECAGRENNIEITALLFEKLKNELEKVITFLSQPNWMEAAKRGKVVTDEKLDANNAYRG